METKKKTRVDLSYYSILSDWYGPASSTKWQLVPVSYLGQQIILLFKLFFLPPKPILDSLLFCRGCFLSGLNFQGYKGRGYWRLGERRSPFRWREGRVRELVRVAAPLPHHEGWLRDAYTVHYSYWSKPNGQDQNIEWFIEDQAFLRSYYFVGGQLVSFPVFLCVAGRAHWRERGNGWGGGGAKS